MVCLQVAEDSAGDFGDLVELFGREGVDEQAPYFPGVGGIRFLQGGKALSCDHRVYAAGAVPFTGDQPSCAHPAELVVQTALLPADHPGQLVGAEPPLGHLGNAGAMTTGDVQWMTAGHGIIHRELAFRNERAHTLQLWVNMPRQRKLASSPHYQDLLAVRRPVIERDGTRVDLIAGEADGITGPAVNEWPISGAIITLEPGRRLEHLLPGRDRAFLYALAGEVTIAGRAVAAGQIAWSDPIPGADVSSITLETADGGAPSVVMVYSGEPIGEPVTFGGPFVMNTEAEIADAFRDFQAGKFGVVPRLARLRYR